MYTYMSFRLQYCETFPNLSETMRKDYFYYSSFCKKIDFPAMVVIDNEVYYYFLIKYLILQIIFQENQENNQDCRLPLQQYFTCTKCYVWFSFDACTFVIATTSSLSLCSP